jgi:hypothetical protein
MLRLERWEKVKKIKVKFKLFEDEWTAYLVDSHNPSLIVDGKSCTGAAWLPQRKIYVSNELDKFALKRTLTHEVSHAVIYATQFVMPEQYDEEQMCDFMAIYGETIVKKVETIQVQIEFELLNGDKE